MAGSIITGMVRYSSDQYHIILGYLLNGRKARGGTDLRYRGERQRRMAVGAATTHPPFSMIGVGWLFGDRPFDFTNSRIVGKQS